LNTSGHQSRIQELAEDYRSSKRVMMKALAEIVCLRRHEPVSVELASIIEALSVEFGKLNKLYID
jgi:hypothetical protein